MISPMLRRCLLDRIDWADPTWKLWVEQEQVTRLCIHWYEFRCIRGFLSFPPSDHPGYRHSMLLPAADELWRAETAEQWHKLRMPLHRPCSEIDSLQLHRIFHQAADTDSYFDLSHYCRKARRNVLSEIAVMAYELTRKVDMCGRTSEFRLEQSKIIKMMSTWAKFYQFGLPPEDSRA